MAKSEFRCAVCVVATGLYARLFPGFVAGVRAHWLPGVRSDVFAWSERPLDGMDVWTERLCAGFPADSMHRFAMLAGRADELAGYDVVYLLNANARVVEPIGSEVLPDGERDMVAVQAPAYVYGHGDLESDTERRSECGAYIAERAYDYVAGGVLGGRGAAFAEAVCELADRQARDELADLVPPRHDESYWNAYRAKHAGRFRVLHHGFCCPDNWGHDVPRRIVMINKSRFFAGL